MTYRPTFAELDAASDVLGWLYEEMSWGGILYHLTTDGNDPIHISHVRHLLDIATECLEGGMKK